MATIPSEVVLNVKTKIDSIALVRPGDTLVVAFRNSVNVQEVDEMREQFEERCPGVKVAIIDNVSGMAVYRPGELGVALCRCRRATGSRMARKSPGNWGNGLDLACRLFRG